MAVLRRGHIPRPPTGIDEHADEIYTQGGFFGDWVHIFRRHNPGVPSSWSNDDLMYAGLDIARAIASDDPVALLVGDGIRICIARPTQAFHQKNADMHQIRFYHRGTFSLRTELGPLDASPGDFVVIGRGLTFSEEPTSDDGVVIVFETADPIACAEAMWESVGFVSMFVDFSKVEAPTPSPSDATASPTEVRVWSGDAWHTMTYDFDPCDDVVGWIGDPVIFKLNVWDAPGIGTSRGFLPPPAHAVLMSENKSFFFNVLGVPPLPTQPAPDASFGAPAHLNDYDEVWFNHTSQLAPDGIGHLWLLPCTVPHPGAKREPSYPPNPVRALDEIKINFDTRAKLHWTDEARAAFLEGDVRRGVFASLYGIPPEVIDALLGGA